MTSEGGPGGGGSGRAGVTGLRRFVKRPAGAPAPGPPAPGAPAPGGQAPEARLAGDPGIHPGQDADQNAERCEMCQTVLPGWHGHLVDTDKRSIACACRACYLLFTHEGAAGGKYRAIPERICRDPERPLAELDWNDLQIPVTMAFFFYNSALGRVVAGYPSPGGVTECELDLEAWDRLAASYPLLAELTPDTEAIFVQKDEIFLIPIDRQGFDGGAEVREALDKFLTGLRRRAVVLAPAAPGRTASMEGEPLRMERH